MRTSEIERAIILAASGEDQIVLLEGLQVAIVIAHDKRVRLQEEHKVALQRAYEKGIAAGSRAAELARSRARNITGTFVSEGG